MARLLSLSRYIILVPVVVTLLGAAVLIVAGTIEMFSESITLFSGDLSETTIKQATVGFINVVDVFLLATVMYIIAVGLYELFIGTLDLPGWLEFKSFDDLKAQLLSVIVAVLAVLFLGSVVAAKDVQLLPLGLAVSAVIFALTLFLSSKTGKSGAEKAKRGAKEAANEGDY
jgi:uncharacterized membrane protein YqhA